MLNTEMFKFWILPKNRKIDDIEAWLNNQNKRGRRPTRPFRLGINKKGEEVKYFYVKTNKPRGLPQKDAGKYPLSSETIAERNLARKTRDDEFIRLFTKEAKSLQEIGDVFGISRERVRQRLKACGFDKEIGGFSLKCAIKRMYESPKVDLREEKCLNWFGCSREVRDSFGSPHVNGTLSSNFKWQKHNAGSRGIEWNLTLPEWVEIWQESGYLELRGRGKGKYAMTRICDSGGYTKGNIIIKSNVENIQEARDMDDERGRYTHIFYKDIEYRSFSLLCRTLNVNAQTILARMKRGLTLDEAINAIPRYSKDK